MHLKFLVFRGGGGLARGSQSLPPIWETFRTVAIAVLMQLGNASTHPLCLLDLFRTEFNDTHCIVTVTVV